MLLLDSRRTRKGVLTRPRSSGTLSRSKPGEGDPAEFFRAAEGDKESRSSLIQNKSRFFAEFTLGYQSRFFVSLRMKAKNEFFSNRLSKRQVYS